MTRVSPISAAIVPGAQVRAAPAVTQVKSQVAAPVDERAGEGASRQRRDAARARAGKPVTGATASPTATTSNETFFALASLTRGG